MIVFSNSRILAPCFNLFQIAISFTKSSTQFSLQLCPLEWLGGDYHLDSLYSLNIKSLIAAHNFKNITDVVKKAQSHHENLVICCLIFSYKHPLLLELSLGQNPRFWQFHQLRVALSNLTSRALINSHCCVPLENSWTSPPSHLWQDVIWLPLTTGLASSLFAQLWIITTNNLICFFSLMITRFSLVSFGSWFGQFQLSVSVLDHFRE